MGVALASELHSCAGRPLSSSNLVTEDLQPQVADEEAATNTFIPAEGISATLISARRILVTGGVLSDDRVLPFTVLRYLDLDTGPAQKHAWTKPHLLRAPSRRKRKRPGVECAFPVCRMEHTITHVPDLSAPTLYLVGGMKVGGKDEGRPCKTMFAFSLKTNTWSSVDIENPVSKLKPDGDQALGPRFAHTAVYLTALRSATRAKARKSPGYILVYGGYTSTDARSPTSTVHLFDVRNRRWQLLTPQRGISAPHRAYNAAAVTPCAQYLVVHGGCCADFWDTYMLSADLFVYDLDTAEWIRPALVSTSAEQPAARRRHSMVNGIGRHEGSLIIFGGQLADGTYSNDLFVLRIIAPAAADQPLSAIWEKFDVQLPERPLPLPTENNVPDQQPPQNGPQAPSTAVAGGSMIPVPALNKYLFLGGRGAYGMRASPLLLDPTEAENIDRVERLPLAPVRATAGAIVPITTALDAGQPVLGTETGGSRVAKLRPSSPNSRSLRSDDFVKIPGPSKRPRSGSKGVTSPGTPGRFTLSKAVIHEDDSRLLAKETRMIAKNKAAIQQQIDRPATNVHAKSAVHLCRNGLQTEDDDSLINLITDDLGGDRGLKPSGIDGSKASFDLETPPTKRRRFINGSLRNPQSKTSKPGNDANRDRSPDSSGSDFIAASDLARRGRSRTAIASRGRGRGRIGAAGRGRARTVSATVARETQKRLEFEEASNLENGRRVKELELELEKEQKEKELINKDNRDLNEQLKALLSEVQSLRTSRKTQLAASALLERAVPEQIFSQTKASPPGICSGPVFAPIRDVKSTSGNGDEVRALLSKISDLKEECQEISADRDALNKSLKEAEEETRRVETEVNMLKNRLEDVGKEKDTLRKQTSELRNSATMANVAAEEAKTQVAREEETSLRLKRVLENVKRELHEEQTKRVEAELKVSSAQRQLIGIRGQLVEAQKKYSQFESTERRLKGEVGSVQGRAEEVQGLLSKTKSAKQRLEEKNIELATELESVKADLGKSSKEGEGFARKMDELKTALNSEKKSLSDLELEMCRVRRDLDAERKRSRSLAGLYRKRDQALQTLRPVLARITNQLGEITSSPEEDLEDLLGEKVVAERDGKTVAAADADIIGRSKEKTANPPRGVLRGAAGRSGDIVVPGSDDEVDDP